MIKNILTYINWVYRLSKYENKYNKTFYLFSFLDLKVIMNKNE